MVFIYNKDTYISYYVVHFEVLGDLLCYDIESLLEIPPYSINFSMSIIISSYTIIMIIDL